MFFRWTVISLFFFFFFLISDKQMFFYVKFSNKMFVSYMLSVQYQNVFSNLRSISTMCFEHKVSVVLLGLYLVVLHNHKCWRIQNLVALRATCVWCWFWMSVIRAVSVKAPTAVGFLYTFIPNWNVSISGRIWEEVLLTFLCEFPAHPLGGKTRTEQDNQYKVELKYKKASQCHWENGNYWKG